MISEKEIYGIRLSKYYMQKILIIISLSVSLCYSQSYLNNQGKEYFEIGYYNSAIAKFTEAIEQYPNNAEAYHQRGRAYYRLEKHSKALVDAQKACELGDCKLLYLMNKKGL